MSTSSNSEAGMTEGTGPAVVAERRRAERVQDAVGLTILRLQDQPAAGDAENPSTVVVDTDRPSHKISLSSVGVAFAHDLLMRPGELISMYITLFPSKHTIRADGRIVSANTAPEISDGDKPTYRVTFEAIEEIDREVIEAHVAALSKQRPTIE